MTRNPSISESACLHATVDAWNADPNGEHELHVRWLISPGEAVRRNVRVTISGGIVEQIRDLPDSQSAAALPFALVPPFVNAHTHLEFSALDHPLSPADSFTDWIRAVIHSRANGQVSGAIERGIAESAASGVMAIGEITTSLLPNSQVPMTVVSFQECLGLGQQRIADQLTAAEQHLERLQVCPGIVAGLSPHAPYSVHPELFDSLVDLAARHQVPVAMHLAETTAELQLLASATGAFVPFLQQVGVWNGNAFPGRRSPMNYLKRLAELPRSLAIHCNYLTSAEQEFVSRNPQIAVVYCPRTHHYFGHSPHPWRELLQASATVILGTDSRASNPDLSIWKELQFVLQLAPDCTLANLLPLITTEAAAALGLDPAGFTIRENHSLNGVLLALDKSRQTASKTQDVLSAADWIPVATLRRSRITIPDFAH